MCGHSKRLLTGAALFAQPAGAVEQSSERPESGHFPPEQTRPHTHTNTLMHAHICHCLRLSDFPGTGAGFRLDHRAPCGESEVLIGTRAADPDDAERARTRRASRPGVQHGTGPCRYSVQHGAGPCRPGLGTTLKRTPSLAWRCAFSTNRGGAANRPAPNRCTRLPHRKSKSTHSPQ